MVIDGMLAIGGLAIVIIVFVNAVLRGAAGFDLSWSLEVVQFLLLWLTFLGCAAASARGAHMRVTEVVSNLVPAPLHWPLTVAIDVLIAVLLCSMIVNGVNISAHTWAQLTTVLYWPVGLHYASLPVGMSVTLLFHVVNFLIDLRARKSGVFAGSAGPDANDWEDFE
ncbi:2,3-diketo-L-gulonate TRAP transporter small permease protein YiaM [Oceanibacterium hippocampi]|uniref:TRAP transporter small permease protein n=2 Tax=Oceanibacterium hippocampi TaxID=745714 RepID=A0A1Y5TIS7_9PROT|nr:2,3-diketo-L-gulonate TRAP transporter small permease protein YiaM [Oceanibacterium hippocampi]